VKKFYSIAFALSIVLATFSQNIVPNPSFDSILMPMQCGLFYGASFNNTSHNWSHPSLGTADLYSPFLPIACNNAMPVSTGVLSRGSQTARTGNYFAGIAIYSPGSSNPNYREHLHCKLDTNMISGGQYLVEMYVSLAERNQYNISNLEVFFSDSTFYVNNSNPIPLNPQIKFNTTIGDTINWVKVCDTITANSNWEYITIGNFNSNINSNAVLYNPSGRFGHAYIFIDDVSVTPLQVVLPVDFGELQARQEAQKVEVEFETLTEINSDYFMIQRSVDGKHWKNLGTVEAYGNSSLLINYSYTDEQPIAGTLYYRIKQVDFNGLFKYSKTVDCEFNLEQEHSVSLKYAQNQLTIETEIENLEVEVFNLDGKLATKKHKLNIGSNTVSINNKSKGIYMIKIVGDNFYQVSKVVF